jgi:hypothetical protein
MSYTWLLQRNVAVLRIFIREVSPVLQGQKRAKKSYDLRWQSASIPVAHFKPKSREELNRVP